MSHPLREILLKLCRREDLSRAEARQAFIHIMSGHAAEAQIGGLLVGLAAKGTTVDELVGAATVMRDNVIPVGCDDAGVVLDTCGTGGVARHDVDKRLARLGAAEVFAPAKFEQNLAQGMAHSGGNLP